MVHNYACITCYTSLIISIYVSNSVGQIEVLDLSKSKLENELKTKNRELHELRAKMEELEEQHNEQVNC